MDADAVMMEETTTAFSLFLFSYSAVDAVMAVETMVSSVEMTSSIIWLFILFSCCGCGNGNFFGGNGGNGCGCGC